MVVGSTIVKKREIERLKAEGVEIFAILWIFLFVILCSEKSELANSIVTFVQHFQKVFNFFCFLLLRASSESAFFQPELDVRIDTRFFAAFSYEILDFFEMPKLNFVHNMIRQV